MPEWYAKKTFADLLDEAVEKWGQQEALYHEGRRLSFAELRNEVDAVARGLIALGVKPGDKVALWMPNRPEWIFAFFAISKIGAVVVPVNTRFRSVDLEYVLRQSDSRALLTVDQSGPIDYLALTREVLPEIVNGSPSGLCAKDFPELRHVVILGSEQGSATTAWIDMLQQGAKVEPGALQRRRESVDPDSTTLMMYTSGTTGFPKGVMHSHVIQRNLVDIGSRLGYRSDDAILVNWPLFHVAGLYLGPLFCVVTGARTVLTTTFDPAESLRLVDEERITRLWGFDTQLSALMNHPNCKAADLSSLRMGVGPVGMTGSELAVRRAQEELCATVSGWGMTEVGAGVAMGFPEGSEEDRYLTSGHPLPGVEFKIIEPESGQTLPDGEAGELCVRSYSVMQGYYKKPEETRNAIDREGWFHTGDMAIKRADGAIRFIGRYKDQLKVGGENVDPAEVESFLLGHPAVSEVQIVGAADDHLSEVVCACVVPRTGYALDNDELVKFCQGKLASFKVPRHTLLLDEFPMTPSGKAQKFKLREMIAREIAEGRA